MLLYYAFPMLFSLIETTRHKTHGSLQELIIAASRAGPCYAMGTAPYRVVYSTLPGTPISCDQLVVEGVVVVVVVVMVVVLVQHGAASA